MQPSSKEVHRVRFAVVGLGHIAQVGVLPAFEHAQSCELSALVSGDPEKLEALGKRYGVPQLTDYAGYHALLDGGSIDAVYLTLPNDLHADYAVRAADRGVHVLCEKPLAASAEECEALIAAARDHDALLMVAYRLHFEHINLEVADLVQSGAIGDPRLFSSVFSQSVKPGDIRLAAWDDGGGSVFDMGVYCINAARHVFRSDPIEVVASATFGTDSRFSRCDEMTSVVLKFPEGRIAQFCSSMGAYGAGDYRVLGTKGEIVVRHAYEYAETMSYELVSEFGDVRSRRMSRRDQFGAELEYFARCIRQKRQPEPDGWEGYADVRVVSAIHEAARTGRRVELQPFPKSRWPGPRQAIWRPGIEEPEPIRAAPPNG